MATTNPRILIEDFSLANPLYSGATVTFFTVDPTTLKATAQLATLYSDLVSNTTLANPQQLDGEGKWLQPVYVAGPCIIIVSGASNSAANVQTGVVGSAISFQGDWLPNTQYFTGNTVRDGASGTNTSGVYFCAAPHLSGNFANDLFNGLWLKYVDAAAIQAGVIANTLAAAQNSANAAATSATTATTEAGIATTQAGNASASASSAGTSAGSASSSATAAAASAATAQSVAGVNAGRNLLHNGMSNVAQRGAGPFTANGVYTLDRWLIGLVSSDTISVTQAALADADRSAISDESAINAMQLVTVGSVGGSALIAQRIESLRRLSNKTITASFWAKASSGTPKIGIGYSQNFGSGGSPSASVTGNLGVTANLSTTWTRYTITASLPSASGKTFGSTANTDFTELSLFTSAGNADARAGGIGQQSSTVLLWGLQLEIAGAATAVEARDPMRELQLCQRFFQYHQNVIISCVAGSGANFFSDFPFPVTMRAAPTPAFDTTSFLNASGITTNTVNTSHAQLKLTASAAGSCWGAGNLGLSADL